MIPPIDRNCLLNTPQIEACKPPSFQAWNVSTLSSMRCSSCFCYPFQLIKRFFVWIWTSIENAVYRLRDKISPTTEELDQLEQIIEGAFFGAANLLHDEKKGKEIIKEVAASSHLLYARLGKKWFPNIEGTLFLRVAVLKIAIRCHAVLGEGDQIAYCRKTLKEIGGVIDDDLEKQIEFFSHLSKEHWKPQMILKAVNFIAQSVVQVLSRKKS